MIATHGIGVKYLMHDFFFISRLSFSGIFLSILTFLCAYFGL